MSTYEIELSESKGLRKYVRVIASEDPWNSNFYACVDHKEISPKFEGYLRFVSGGLKSEEYPRLVFRNLRSLSNVQRLLQSLDDSTELDPIALESITQFGREELARIDSEDSLTTCLESDDWHLYTPGKNHRLFVYASLLIICDEIEPLAALEQAESKFGYALNHKDYFVAQWTDC